MKPMIETCPFCDSFNYSEISEKKFFCRDCGEKWTSDEYSFLFSEGENEIDAILPMKALNKVLAKNKKKKVNTKQVFID